MNIHYRQGDVLLQRIPSIPKDAVERKRDEHGRIVLAHGERTGHAHAIRNPSVCGFSKQDAGEIEFLLVEGGGGSLNHELISGAKAEHDVINVPDGAYRLGQQVEYSPAELVRVPD